MRRTIRGFTLIELVVDWDSAWRPREVSRPPTSERLNEGCPIGMSRTEHQGRRLMRRLLSFLIVAAGMSGTTRADTLYVGEDRNNSGDINRIDRYDTSTGIASPPLFASLSFTARGLAVDSVGNLFVTDVTNNRIVEFTPGGVMSIFSTSLLLSNPHALAFDSAGNLYVANAASGTIVEFTPNGVGSIFNSQSTADVPVGLAFDSAGNLYVSDNNSNKIVRITPAGVATNFATTGVANPAGMAFDKDGNLFVSSEGTFSIVKYAPDGSFSTFANVPGISAGLAFDSAGNLYESTVAPAPNAILRFTPDGQESTFTTTAGRPIFVTISPSAVPEPAGFVLLGSGALGVLGYRWRHRGRTRGPDVGPR